MTISIDDAVIHLARLVVREHAENRRFPPEDLLVMHEAGPIRLTTEYPRRLVLEMEEGTVQVVYAYGNFLSHSERHLLAFARCRRDGLPPPGPLPLLISPTDWDMSVWYDVIDALVDAALGEGSATPPLDLPPSA